MSQPTHLTPQYTKAVSPRGTRGMAGRSPFMSLPPELRNNIYEYMFSKRTIRVRFNHRGRRIGALVTDGRSVEPPADGICPALLRTCKQVYEEAAQLFYARNRFEVAAYQPGLVLGGRTRLQPDREHIFLVYMLGIALREFLKVIGVRNTKALTDVTFDIGQVDLRGRPSSFNLSVIMELLESLRRVHTLNSRWHLKVSMSLVLTWNRDSGYNPPITESQEFVADVADPKIGIASVMAALEDKDARDDVECYLYESDELQQYVRFFGQVQTAVLSRSW
ncbi:hypothetical protein LTR48_006608 [Friedmanniomyces endolithicus]|uniref:DUF7730 domain-containing protein n=1 Tax=Rachicladosporium monterosium TaxID=1507873 RepID=A0ABR0KYH5_9PEZI|nr:hypothetical protein LTR29_013401 [Friedmanniomyces endolithicus]KAK1082975.1 hypothetical protein LTR48_006608 [Friedmanniomyces endolithicus]KAK1812216.1 hypothetical protein LTR12_013422 [Friedmanniomyces endolithicus]KAK5140673.1 hypothetical protein LTR32_006584 [Rachicladosporium monterosium]